jgi:aspartate/methionine/tyrosine aminotransferase
MSFVPFELERWQSTWEHHVRFNLSESGVHPLTTGELLRMAGAKLDSLEGLRLGYSQADGTEELRAAISGLYEGTSDNNVIVTVGSSEANFITGWTLIQPGDRVAILSPLYRQTWGLAQNLGAEVATFDLKEELGWEPDPADIERAIAPGTRLVVVTNPNNPTGHVLSENARKAIVERTREVGAWLQADEVYVGAELDGEETQSFWGTYDKVVVVSGLSKAYGLPGLRIGWAVGPEDFKQSAYERHDYTVICPTAPSDFMARCALEVRDQILSRTRGIMRENYPVLEGWLNDLGDAASWSRPDCGAICFPHLRNCPDTVELAHKVRGEYDVLIQPGEHFGLAGYIRFGYGEEPQHFKEALEVLKPAFEKYVSTGSS